MQNRRNLPKDMVLHREFFKLEDVPVVRQDVARIKKSKTYIFKKAEKIAMRRRVN